MLELQTFFIAMTPIGELRASIPMGILIYGLSFKSAFIISVLGNLVPVVFLLLFLEKFSNYLSRRSYFFNRFFAWFFRKTKNSNEERFRRWKEFALVIMVAIPFPFTGAWTGSICAFLFGIPPKKAFPLIITGILIAGVIVTLVTLGIAQSI